ncbi:MAG: CRISPR-associated helicase Cas3' [Planctomycetaceae bacterium]|nr:CRISPR-associated helicase Cas3' [Planctomycetaceae bacterium]
MTHLNAEKYREFFRKLTRKERYDYQERVADILLAGRNVILRAPTGAGKTWAALAPFFYSRQIESPIADRVLYALPLRSLATSLFRETRNDAIAAGMVDVDIRLQTGETRDDRFFESDIVFTTIDQLLSSYLFHPVSLPARKIGNINAGALIGSLIVFDEFHLLEPGKSMSTAIEMLDRLVSGSPLAQFVLMTATLCTDTVEWLAQKLNADIVTLPLEEVAALPSQEGKKRFYRLIDRPMTVEDIVACHSSKRTIVLANSVSRAQQLFAELTSSDGRKRFSENTEFRLLHSRYLPEDRKAAEDCLADWFGPKVTRSDVVLVTTQVIEAGMDLSCDNLHTELAPMNSLVQRGGRCARRRNETGTVWVYELEESPDGKRRLGPYRDRAVIVDDTRKTLIASLSNPDTPVASHEELAWVDCVHADEERKALGNLRNLNGIRDAVHLAMDGDNANAARELVRDVDSIDVIVTATPDEIRFDRKQWPRAISIPRMSLWTLRDAIESKKAPWVVKTAREKDVLPGGGLFVEWIPLRTKEELPTAGWMIAVHPNFASYSPKLGLQLGVAGVPMSLEPRVRPAFTQYSYEFEPYSLHIRRVRDAAIKHFGKCQRAAELLGNRYGVTKNDVERWVDVACALHDIGKLATGWQTPIMNWQNLKDDEAGRTLRNGPIAHSDFDPETDRTRQRDNQFRRPPHAAEGAWAVSGMLAASLEEIAARAIFTAITRHHVTWSEELGNYAFPESAANEVRSTVGDLLPPATVRLLDKPGEVTRRDDFRSCLLRFHDLTDAPAWAAYAWIVRRLRLADQASLKGDQ